MVYQLSEKNQILVALFAIVVLCAGKLFKDYLYRGGYVEGLKSQLVSNQHLERSGSPQNGITLQLKVTLGANLSSGETITVTWPTGKGITMSATPEHYVITGGSFTNNAGSLSTGTNTITATFSAPNAVNKDTIVTITMSNITITAGSTGISEFSFTTRTSAEQPVHTPVIVMGAGVADSPDYIKEIESAIGTINERLKNATGTEQSDLTRVQSALVTVLAYTYGTVKQAGNVFSSKEL
jgi:hypothetical protein